MAFLVGAARTPATARACQLAVMAEHLGVTVRSTTGPPRSHDQCMAMLVTAGIPYDACYRSLVRVGHGADTYSPLKPVFAQQLAAQHEALLRPAYIPELYLPTTLPEYVHDLRLEFAARRQYECMELLQDFTLPRTWLTYTYHMNFIQAIARSLHRERLYTARVLAGEYQMFMADK